MYIQLFMQKIKIRMYITYTNVYNDQNMDIHVFTILWLQILVIN